MISAVLGIRSLFLATPALTAIVGDRVYVGRAPKNATVPYVLVTKIATDFNGTLEASAGGLAFQDVDVDCYGATPAAADTLANAVKTFFQDFAGAAGSATIEAVILNDETDEQVPPVDGGDQARSLVSLDFTVQYR